MLNPHNTFQQHLKSTTRNQLQSNISMSSQNFALTSNPLIEPKTIDNAILPQTIPQESHQLYQNPSPSKKIKVDQNQSTTVTPIAYMSDPNAPIPYNAAQMQYDPSKCRKIQIKCQPRSKFRPRTQNESKNSSHYLRCEEGVEQDYPAIYVPQIWSSQSDTNIIEVALMDIEKQPHPYILDNKMTRASADNERLIFKKGEQNVLYFRLTNDDFLSGFKTFMIELIKSKQDDVITKKLIQIRKLNQSILRFARIYRDERGEYQRDSDSEEYSCIMTESYGDVSVEQMGPRYGPICGKELMFVTFKGRIAKDDFSIIISEETTDWSHEIQKITLNGTLIYFQMPAFPHLQLNHVKATVNIYFKQQKIHESTYFYMNLFEHELAELNLNDSVSNIDISATFNRENQDSPIPLTSSNAPKTNVRKRVNSK